MPNLKKIFKSKTFFIPAVSYIAIIILLFLGAVLEAIKIFPTSDMGGLFFWALIFISLPVVWLRQLLSSVTHYTLEGLVGVSSLVLMFIYHLLIGFGLGFLINFIYSRLKSTKTLNIDKTNESAELKLSNGSNRKKSSMQKIVLIILGTIIVLILLVLAMMTFLLLDKSSPISRIICQQKNKQMTKVIKRANYCIQDDDCATIDFLGCGKRLVHKNWVKQIQNRIKSINKWCVPINTQCPVLTATNFRCNNGKCEFVDEQAKIITIQTDKEAYQQSENIIVILKNNLAAPIKITDEDYISGGVADLEKKIEGGWQKIDLAVRPHVSPKKELLPGESYNYRWDQNILMIESPGPMPLGIYRFKFYFDQTGYVYSNEFEIKAKVSQMENYCQKDENCVLASRNDCCYTCNTPDAVNKTEKENRRQWREENCYKEKAIPCPQIKCQVERVRAICLNNQCTKVAVKKENEECSNDFECQNIDCSKYDTPAKEGRQPYCIDNKCKCMCYGCE